MDRRPDDFYEKFMEQRFQKLNIPGQSGLENSLPFPFEPLRTAPVTLPQKRISNTSSDSGVNSPHFLSPARPKASDNSEPHPIPSTSRKNPPSGPLTPIQLFISNNRKPKKKESKNNCSQPEYPDPQSVFRTGSRKGYKLSIFYFIFFFWFPIPWNSLAFIKLSVFFLFQINMPKCHKIYPNCIWQVSTERHTLGFYSALLTEVYWCYATHIVRVCVTPISRKNIQAGPHW